MGFVCKCNCKHEHKITYMRKLGSYHVFSCVCVLSEAFMWYIKRLFLCNSFNRAIITCYSDPSSDVRHQGKCTTQQKVSAHFTRNFQYFWK